MFLKYDPYRVWCSIFYSKLVNCILFKIIVQHVRFVKGRRTCISGERNVKILIDFRKSPRFSLTSPLSQLRENSSFYYVWWALGYIGIFTEPSDYLDLFEISSEVLTVLLVTEQIYNLYMLDIKINQQYKYMVFEITTDQWLFCCVF
jgi:hypothetical protein